VDLLCFTFGNRSFVFNTIHRTNKHINNLIKGVTMDEKTIKIKVKQVYGKDTYYPASDNAKVFAKIAGTTTLTITTLKLIKQLGYAIQATQNNISAWI
jgi:hypothetical protein